VAGVLGRPRAAGERDELRRRETTPTHTTETTATHRKLGGTVETTSTVTRLVSSKTNTAMGYFTRLV